jgi:GNAT superfamily N-acetyltransferase
MPPNPQVLEVDPLDEDLLRAFWETEQAAIRPEREHALLRTWERLRAMSQNPNEWSSRTMLVARNGDEVVGVAELGGSLRDNLHLADVAVVVLPAHRRRGIGRVLYDEAIRRLSADGRTSICGEVYVPPGGNPEEAPGYAFASMLGFESVHTEDHLMLRLPVAQEEIDRLRAKADAAAYDVITWTGPCPDEHLAAFCEMQTRMSNDVPVGGIDYEPVVVDEARQRAREERVFRSFDGITAVARRAADGTFGGYSQLFLPHGADYVYQDDTLVMPDHRGHRLGTLLKLATLEIVQRDRPELAAIHTDTAVDNHAMQATNRDFGYRPVERLHEMQQKLV